MRVCDSVYACGARNEVRTCVSMCACICMTLSHFTLCYADQLCPYIMVVCTSYIFVSCSCPFVMLSCLYGCESDHGNGLILSDLMVDLMAKSMLRWECERQTR